MSIARGLARRVKHFNPTDGTFPYLPNLPRHESSYTPTGPVIGGRAKCEKKGHHPSLWWGHCTRCKQGVF